jgi:hypothetical protein
MAKTGVTSPLDTGSEIDIAAVRYVKAAKTTKFRSTPFSPHDTWSRCKCVPVECRVYGV